MKAYSLILLLIQVAYLLALNTNNITTDFEYPDNIVSYDADLQKDLEEIARVKTNSRLAACMAIVRNSLSAGNPHVEQALKDTKHDKSVTFDKIVLMMYENCEKKITEDVIDQVLLPDNIMNNNPEYLKLIEFNKNIFSIIGPTPSLSKRENEIMKEINEISTGSESESQVVDEDIGFFGMKLSQIGFMKYMFVGCAIALTIFIVFGGFWMIYRNKKNTEKAKKKKNK